MEILHILIRVSTQIQEDDGTSLKTQQEQGIELSKKLKMKYQIHNEGGTSSNKDTLDDRPIMVNLLNLMDQGKIKHLFVYNTDRISRNQTTWYLIRQKMVKNEVILYTSTGKYDTSGTMENLILGILSEVSQYDNKVRTERSRIGKLEKVKQNYYRGGHPPFGFRIDKVQGGSKLVIDEYESKYILTMYTMYSEGHSIKEIKRRLEREQVITRRGNKHWSLGSIQLILRNQTYIGIDQYHDKKSNTTVRNNIPQIVSNTLFDKVQSKRLRTLRRKGQMNRTQHRYLIRDIMYCSCGTPIGGRTKSERSIHHYYCPQSERKFNKSYPSENVCTMKRCVNIQPTEELVWNTLKGLLKDTVDLKTHVNYVLKENPEFSVMLRRQRYKLTRKLKELKNELLTVSDGIVELEKKKILKQFNSEDIYVRIKKNLNTDYRKINVKIENTNNLLTLHYQRDKWYSSLDNISELINSKKTFSYKEKKTLVHLFIQSITLSYIKETKVHELNLFLKIPLVFNTNKTKDLKNVPTKNTSQNLEGQLDQTNTLNDYSTVTDLARFLG